MNPVLNLGVANNSPQKLAVFTEAPSVTNANRYANMAMPTAFHIGILAEVIFISSNVKEHAPLSAGAGVDNGVEVETTEDHVNRAADRGCWISFC